VRPNIDCLVVARKERFRRFAARTVVDTVSRLNELVVLNKQRRFIFFADECILDTRAYFLCELFRLQSSLLSSFLDLLTSLSRDFFCLIGRIGRSFLNLLASELEEFTCLVSCLCSSFLDFLTCMRRYLLGLVCRLSCSLLNSLPSILKGLFSFLSSLNGSLLNLVWSLLKVVLGLLGLHLQLLPQIFKQYLCLRSHIQSSRRENFSVLGGNNLLV